MSIFIPLLSSVGLGILTNCYGFVRLWYRHRREYRVFRKLLGMVPHLEERLMECSNEASMAMADMVRPSLLHTTLFAHHFYYSFRKVSPVPGRTTPKV